MTFFSPAPTFTGMERLTERTRLAHLKKTREGWKVLELKTIPATENVKPLYTTLLVSALPSTETWSRRIELKATKKKDVKAALDFQIEPLLPYPVEHALLQVAGEERGAQTTRLTAFSVRHSHLKKHIEGWQERGLEPEKVTCVPHALTTLSTLFPPTPNPLFLIHEGEKEVTCLLIEKGYLLATRAFEATLPLGKEVHKTLLSFMAAHKTKSAPSLLLLGKESESIMKATGKPVFIPTTSLALSQEELCTYAVAIGAALAAETVNFRRPPFAYPHVWKRMKRPLLLASSLTLLLLSVVGITGHTLLHQEKREIAHLYQTMVAEKGENRTLPLPTTLEGYRGALLRLARTLEADTTLFPLHPSLPKVEEVLSWLAAQQGISLSTFHYETVNYPSLSHPREKYSVKVSLSFLADSAESASHLHLLLTTPNPFLDPNAKVEWRVSKNTYHATFYLQDKTEYFLCNDS